MVTFNIHTHTHMYTGKKKSHDSKNLKRAIETLKKHSSNILNIGNSHYLQRNSNLIQGNKAQAILDVLGCLI